MSQLYKTPGGIKMFCPSCGLQDTQSNQYCRSCGADLGSVRVVFKSPDKITASATGARDDIGRAIADKIKQATSSSELSEFAEEVLPEIEKFLESPEERRLRRIRTGSLISFIGLGVAIGFFIASVVSDPDVIIMAAMGLVTLFIGLAFIANGLFFSVPKKTLAGGNPLELGAKQNEADAAGPTTNDLLMPAPGNQEFTSVTEHTTRHLKDKKPLSKS